MHELYDVPFAAHPGFTKVYEDIRELLYWPKWEKPSKSTSRPVTAVKSTIPMDRSPEHHFNWSHSWGSLGINFPGFHHKLTQKPRIQVNSRSPLLPVLDGWFHPNSNSCWLCQSRWAVHWEHFQDTYTSQDHYLRSWSKIHISVLDVSVRDSGNRTPIQHSFSSRDGWTNRTSELDLDQVTAHSWICPQLCKTLR